MWIRSKPWCFEVVSRPFGWRYESVEKGLTRNFKAQWNATLPYLSMMLGLGDRVVRNHNEVAHDAAIGCTHLRKTVADGFRKNLNRICTGCPFSTVTCGFWKPLSAVVL